MKKDYMTVKRGIGPKIGKGIYRELKKGNTEIIYYKYKGFLFRQIILEQDMELIKEIGKAEREACKMLVRDKATGQYEVMSADKVYKQPTNDELLEKIQALNNADKGNLLILVFIEKTKEFVALLDVEMLDDSDFTECAVEYFFTKNQVTQKRYSLMVKKYFDEICRKSWLFANGCKEKIWSVDHYQLCEINS